MLENLLKKTFNTAIESVISQTYSNIEYIIIDGGSNDGTLNNIYNYKDNIALILSESDNGIYDAMNKGIHLATGDIIGILNSDDLYENNHIIEEIVYEFIKDNNLDILYGDLVYVNKNDTSKIIRKWISKEYYSNVPPHPSLFIRRRIYLESGIFKL